MLRLSTFGAPASVLSGETVLGEVVELGKVLETPPPVQWPSTTREMRHSFVSLLSDARVPIEDIARLCGHSGTAVTEQVYRHQIRPVMVEAATAMDDIFERRARAAQSPS
ncbi:hypothetical protein B0I33_101509 [Prauserella shujinwangii]|uniref:Tyr recombinase domain-containing protein n=1 Tax=Prauserella shujinwangii TaxID=1453103 RepID=A0A2T0M3M1_9PSEU|nr:hypothetical protein [Prauserella shujinwangii]PRX51355.1 hypothetical protein B0I33_101509 [Prauserella shujinwangii]